jgi:17beta-estradiol 17-dehydrogenase / very-long-chain 3-oxoacyl-CoA reductase
MLSILFFSIGFFYLLKICLYVVNMMRSLKSSFDLSAYKDSWALVTACTDGIGLGFAQTLAQNGINIIQVSRNPLKLKQCASDLSSKYGVQVKSITKDFSECSADPTQFFSDIFDQCKDLDVSILVNNVGNYTEFFFLNSSESVILQQNALNL